MKRKMLSLTLVCFIVGGTSILDWERVQVRTAAAGEDLYMKDTPLDNGTEPNGDPGPMWITEDIWVRTTPDPGYQPYPFPEATPPWIPLPHENPEYRDPKFSVPNYVYVRVRNRGNSPSTGTERLRVYWAKASTGLSWNTQWEDYLANNCGPTKLYGAEITKPRKNAATATVAERDAYRDAILSIGTLPAFVFFGGVSYWHKQDQVHQFGPANRHGTPAFLPWHREYINRYEVLLQEADPLVKLLYWDWTTDPENSTGGFNFFTPSFMGASGRGLGPTSIGLPFIPPLSPPSVVRNLSTSTTPPPDPDASILGNGVYEFFAPDLEQVPNHNSAHGYIGGNMSSIPTAAEDPFFFLLHGNVDRLWSQWQRNTSVLSRLDPATAYDGNSGNVNITTVMRPWDGTGTLIDPWTVGGGYIVSKSPQHASVVSPPIYDSAPLVVPVLQPNEAVVIQIPWYPANPADFACFGDPGHFCLLARIETSTSPPYGMTFPEGPDVGLNTRNNNNIVWKNVTVVDNFPGAAKAASILVRNVFKEPVLTGLRFANAQEIDSSFFDFGRIFVDLKPELFSRWLEAGSVGEGVTPVDGTTIEITSPDAAIQGIKLEPGETFAVAVRFELSEDYQVPRGTRPKWDLIQVGAPGEPDAVVGGQRFELDFDKIVIIESESLWRYTDDEASLSQNWIAADFDDSKWKVSKSALGFGKQAGSPNGGKVERRNSATYFRRAFEVADPSFFRDLLLRLKREDGAVVYLNGAEVHRVNLPTGAIAPATAATRRVSGLEKDVFFPIRVGRELLRAGQNVIAVEVHRSSRTNQDLAFDLELWANPAFTNQPPNVAFVSLANGSQWQTGEAIPIEVEAIDGDGQISSISFFADGKLIGVDENAPYTFLWQGAPLGLHRLRAVALDNDRQRSLIETTISVIENVPPTVVLRQPADGGSFVTGRTIVASARAADRRGAVERVEFYLMDGDLFTAPVKLVGSVAKSPYRISLRGLAPGHYMLTAVARDNRGATSPSLPVHFEVHGLIRGPHHRR